jgi:hypothetical protein
MPRPPVCDRGRAAHVLAAQRQRARCCRLGSNLEFVEVPDQSHLDFDLVLWVGRPEVGGRRRLMDRACRHGRVAPRQHGVEVTGGEAERKNGARRRATRRRRAPQLARSSEGLLARRPTLTETRDGVLHRPLARQDVGDVVPDGATHLRRTFPQERKHDAAAQHTATGQFRRPLANAQAQMLTRAPNRVP